jgi:hypothetical protein
MKHLVTVTCLRDLAQVKTLSKSIQLYASVPCTHWVFVNEPDPDRQLWLSELEPFHDKHALNLIFTCDHTRYQIDPWISQQIWKIRAVEWVQDDYIIFDSKNFFVRETDFIDWHYGSNYISIYDDTNSNDYWKTTLDYYSQVLGKEKLTQSFTVETPFTVRYDVVKAVRDRIIEDSTFLYTKLPDPGCSEFLLYSFFHRDLGYQFVANNKSEILWPGEDTDFKVLRFLYKVVNPHILVSGIHRTWIDRASPKSKKMVSDWLMRLQLYDEMKDRLWQNS